MLVLGGGGVCDVGFNAAGEGALGLEDVFDGVADGALSATVVGDDVGFVFDIFAGVGDGEGESAVAHDGEIDDVVSDEGGLLGLEVFLGEDFTEGGELVGCALGDVLDFEVAGAETDGLRDALGDEPGLDASEAGEGEAGAVMSVEALGFDGSGTGECDSGGVGFDLSGSEGAGNGDEEKLAIGHDAIDIQQQELYLLCTSL